jgi:hypothetical protein
MTSPNEPRFRATLYWSILVLLQWPLCAASLGLLAVDVPPAPFAGWGLALLLAGGFLFAASWRRRTALLTLASLPVIGTGALLALLPAPILATWLWLGLFGLSVGGYLHFSGHRRASLVARLFAIVALGLLALDGTLFAAAAVRPHLRGWSSEGNLFMDDERSCKRLVPSSVVKHTQRGSFEATYHIDPDGNRHVPGRPPTGPEWACTGCSLTFGWGLNDEDTLAAQLQQRRPGTRVFNLGVPAYGTTDAYIRLIQFLEREPECARCIYFFFDDHLMRMGLDIGDFTQDDPVTILQRPAFEVTDGVPRFTSKVAETEVAHDLRSIMARRSRVYSVLFFNVAYTRKKFDLATTLLRDVKRRCEARGVAFLFVRLPVVEAPRPEVAGWLKELSDGGMDVLDLVPRFESLRAEGKAKDEEYFFAQDRHGNRTYDRLMAEWVDEHIGTHGSSRAEDARNPSKEK